MSLYKQIKCMYVCIAVCTVRMYMVPLCDAIWRRAFYAIQWWMQAASKSSQEGKPKRILKSTVWHYTVLCDQQHNH